MKLENCPFCGQKAQMKTRGKWSMIDCDHHDDCFLKDNEDIYFPANDLGKKYLKKSWNYRKKAC